MTSSGRSFWFHIQFRCQHCVRDKSRRRFFRRWSRPRMHRRSIRTCDAICSPRARRTTVITASAAVKIRRNTNICIFFFFLLSSLSNFFPFSPLSSHITRTRLPYRRCDPRHRVRAHVIVLCVIARLPLTQCRNCTYLCPSSLPMGPVRNVDVQQCVDNKTDQLSFDLPSTNFYYKTVLFSRFLYIFLHI
jgi:hypothetical protein